MAIGTSPLTGGSNWRIELDYDDAFTPPRAVAVRCVNTSQGTVTGTVSNRDGTRARSVNFQPGTTVINLPTRAQTRLTCSTYTLFRVRVRYSFQGPA